MFLFWRLWSACSPRASKWPTIRPLEEKRVFINPGQNNADTPFAAFIKDSDGVPVYKLECHNGNYEDESEVNFCALFAVKGTTRTGNLLAADTKNELSTDWWNRGRMRAAQLRGECLKYPEYSTDRRFRLRGMLLTLRFADVEWGPRKDQQGEPMLAGFTFLVKVVPDESTHSSRAELPAGPKSMVILIGRPSLRGGLTVSGNPEELRCLRHRVEGRHVSPSWDLQSNFGCCGVTRIEKPASREKTPLGSKRP